MHIDQQFELNVHDGRFNFSATKSFVVFSEDSFSGQQFSSAFPLGFDSSGIVHAGMSSRIPMLSPRFQLSPMASQNAAGTSGTDKPELKIHLACPDHPKLTKNSFRYVNLQQNGTETTGRTCQLSKMELKLHSARKTSTKWPVSSVPHVQDEQNGTTTFNQTCQTNKMAGIHRFPQILWQNYDLTKVGIWTIPACDGMGTLPKSRLSFITRKDESWLKTRSPKTLMS